MQKLKYGINEIEKILQDITTSTLEKKTKDGKIYSSLAEEFLDWINEYTKYCIPEQVDNWKKIIRETIYSHYVSRQKNDACTRLINDSEDHIIYILYSFMYAGEIMRIYNETKSWDEVKKITDQITYEYEKTSDIIIQFFPYGAEYIDRFDWHRYNRNNELKQKYMEAKQAQEQRQNLNQRLVNTLSKRLTESSNIEEQIQTKEESVIKYYVLCNKLKNIIRTGWKNWKVKRERLESVAEHIYGVQMLAIAMKSEYKYDVDIQKVIMMLAVHELEEILIGDLTQFEITKEEKQKLGHEAIFKVLNGLLDKNEIISLILEFDERKTKEAIFAYQCDKLECDIQSKLYDEENCVDLNNQEGNKIYENPKVQELLKQEKSWSGMWIAFGQETYNYDENFTSVSNFAKNNNISKYLEQVKMVKTFDIEEWLTRIRLAKYKSLCTTKANEVDTTLIHEIEELLLESGYTKIQLQEEVKNYACNELQKINEVIQVKADEIMHDLLVALDNQEDNKTLNTNQYPEYYYRIQEIVAMDETIGSEILDQAIEKANIEYNVFHNIDQNGNDLGGYTYYFSKKEN